MTKAEFKALTDNMVAAHEEYLEFMKKFVRSVPTLSKVMSSPDLEKARQLSERHRDLEKRWFAFVRSAEPLV